MPTTIPTGIDTATARAIVSSPGRPASARDHPAQPHETDQGAIAAATRSGACERRAGAAQGAHSLQDEESTTRATPTPAISCARSIAWATLGVRRDRQQVACVGDDQRADDLTAERRRR